MKPSKPSEGLLDYLNKVETFLKDQQRKLDSLYGIHHEKGLSELEYDSLERNLQLATEAVIGLSKHWVKLFYGSAPSAASENFDYLKKAKAITNDKAQLWKSIVGTRNILVHDYLDIDEEVIVNILKTEAYKEIFSFAVHVIKEIRSI